MISFLKELMRRRHRLQSQMAADLGVSHVTVGRWLSGEDTPSPRSCQKLAKYSGVPLEKILLLAGHLPGEADSTSIEWPEFRQCAYQNAEGKLPEDLVTMIEDVIECRTGERYGSRDCQVGNRAVVLSKQWRW